MAWRFLVLHGWQGSGPDHWQTWLAQRLRDAGHTVRYPDLPDPDEPVASRWEDALRAELGKLGPGAGSVVLCHSLACVLWLRHALDAPAELWVERVALVAPPCPYSGITELAGFYPVQRDAAAVAAAAGCTRLVCGDSDPYCPSGAPEFYGEPLGLPVDVVPGGGHLNADAGYGPWPQMEDWCEGRAERVYGAKNALDT